jgi:hypothetical protein
LPALIGNAGDMGMPVLDAQALPLLRLREEEFSALFRAAEDELGRAEVFFTILDGRGRDSDRTDGASGATRTAIQANAAMGPDRAAGSLASTRVRCPLAHALRG